LSINYTAKAVWLKADMATRHNEVEKSAFFQVFDAAADAAANRNSRHPIFVYTQAAAAQEL